MDYIIYWKENRESALNIYTDTNILMAGNLLRMETDLAGIQSA